MKKSDIIKGVTMSSGELSFTCFQIFVNENNPTSIKTREVGFEDFPINENELSWLYNSNDTNKTVYKIFRILPTKNGVFFSIEYGSVDPRRDKVFNIVDNTERDNNRTENELELKEQFFAYIDIEKKYLYLSNAKKKLFFKDFIKDTFSINLEIKNIFSDIDKFIEQMSEFNEITFTHIDDLYSINSDIKKFFVDLYGNDAPSRFTLSAKFNKSILSDFIKRFSVKEQNRTIKDLIIKGRDNNNVESIFNTETISKKITINVEKNTENMRDHHLVHKALLGKLNEDI